MRASRRLIAATALNLVFTSLALAAGAAPSEPVLAPLGHGPSSGDAVGIARSGANCAERAEAKAWSDLLAQRAHAELRKSFEARQALHPATAGAAVRITPFLNDLDFDVCSAGRAGWHGKVHVQIAWTVSAPGTGRTVYQASTDGRFEQPAPAAGHPSDGLRRAMDAAVAQLYKDRRFALALAGEERTLTASR